jgi:tripartite-type tricarboxylate transporter receptor subunit TctC
MRREAVTRQRIRRSVVAGLGGMLALAVGRIRAQAAHPSLTLIVPSRAGASADRLGRILAEALSEILETPVKIENISGDAGVVGTNAIAAAPKDGSVLGVAISSAIIGGRLLSRGAKFSPLDDFHWLTILGTFPNAMVISSRSPYRNVAEWLAAARATPLPWVYASLGSGSAGHLAGAYLRLEHGARVVHRGVESNEERYALLAEGKIDVLFEGGPNAVAKGPRPRVRLLAVTSAMRIPSLPAVPSFGELFGQSFAVWIALVAPNGIGDSAYYRLASAVGVLVSDPRHADKLRAAGLTFMGLSGRGTIAFLETEILRNARLIATLNEEGQRK